MAVVPWSVKGVDPEAREAAKMAARRAGMTVGAWLSQTIRSTATEQLKRGAYSVPAAISPSQPRDATEPAHAPDAPPDGSDGPAADDPAPTGPNQPPAPTIQAMFERIQTLSKRLEISEQRTGKLVQPLQSQIETLTQEIERLKGQTGVSTAPVERAVTRLSERIQRLEESQSPDGKRGPFGLLRSK